MRIVFLGSGAFGRPTLEWLADSTHNIPLVITQPARPKGRGRRVALTPIHQLADNIGLRTVGVEDVNLSEFIQEIRSLRADVGLAIAFGQKLGNELCEAFPGGILNLHASLLPKYRGAAPINWAIVHGEKQTGCTVFKIVERMDAGPILSSCSTDIKPEETAGELHDRLAELGVDAVRTALDMFTDGCIPEGSPQDDAQATRAPKLRKTDGAIRFDRPARDVVNHILGMTPWPGAVTRFESKDDRWEQVTITRARVAGDQSGGQVEERAEDRRKPTHAPGTIDAPRYVATQDSYVEILEIKPSSGRVMGWSEYVNGRHVVEGDRFVPVD